MDCFSRLLVNMLIHFRVPLRVEKLLLAKRPAESQAEVPLLLLLLPPPLSYYLRKSSELGLQMCRYVYRTDYCFTANILHYFNLADHKLQTPIFMLDLYLNLKMFT
jgi:hypothetical protein